MTETLVVLVAGLLIVAAAASIGPRIRVAAPLVLVAIGFAASFLPMFADFEIDPELILEGVLPPLLYSAAVSMPAMNFRREFVAISGLSVSLVVVSSLVLGLFFQLVLPDIGFAWGAALGAIISPTDAVATGIVKRSPASKRVVAILEGESLLNDATALVLLRTAIVSAAAAFSFWGAVGTFAYSVVVAVVIGGVVGAVNLAIRSRVSDPTVNTVISIVVPFVASVPAEALGASGLVAAVVAGLVTGIRAPRELSPQHRMSDEQVWRTIELVLEGFVFLTMGLELTAVVLDVQRDHAGVGTAVLIAAGAFVLTVLVRAAWVAPLVRSLKRRSERSARMQERLEGFQDKLATPEGQQETLERMQERRGPGRGGGRSGDLDRFARRVTQGLADIEYFKRAPLGWRDGTVIVWAGMRGAVTVAAAQTLPENTPMRSVLVLIAFAVAVLSLVLQGGTLGWLISRLAPKVDTEAIEAQDAAELRRLMELLRQTAMELPEPEVDEQTPRHERFRATRTHRIAVIHAQRKVLLDARDTGTFDADVLAGALENLDADEIAIELRGRLSGGSAT
ncbi:cation:proton antiporter [Agromyces seonyuensis]|uniref:Sodium:proton antiporter n=1 Tax=Agromyces seonyuensis TaxID=2662446 RepID=A0A6I4P2J4_9MICO|nr:sodium:proton antiporter [Agromyces seonyuensis]MWB98955.1 sodium:proton antiporter [Agromyces seonyuensis]